ncbi:MAG TPA: DUF1360 domain-containing protein [Mycobacteriales bacterium]|jgi:hypothetical protein|nr:DUF1360 domain-containing protein [Mycobacteriales bacterium]
MTSADTLLPDTQAVAEHYGRPASELRGYSGVMAVYAAGVSAAALAMKRADRLPRRVQVLDLALITLAAHKLSRTLSRDTVTSPLRAPFAHFEGAAAPGEVKEEVAGTGVRKAVGELITCPFCMDQWVATGLVTGLAVAPRLTRYVSSIFAVRAGADLLQFGYAAANAATH